MSSSSDDECTIPHRPHSAPSYSLFNISQITSSSTSVESFGKNEQLSGWVPDLRPSTQVEQSQHKRPVKKQRGLRTTSKSSTTKLGKWQQNQQQSQIEFQYTFQHHTDTSQYISAYRTTKLAKVHDVFASDIQEMLNQRQLEICAELAPPTAPPSQPPVGGCKSRRVIAGGGVGVYIQSPVEQEEYPMTYRIDNKRRTKERSKERHMNIKGGQMNYSREDLRTMYKDQQSVPVPKCDAIVFSQQQQQHRHSSPTTKRLTSSGRINHTNSPGNKNHSNNQELYQHTIQCKKLAELSIQKATRYSHQQKFSNNQYPAPGWMPHDALPPRESIKLRSAEERRRRRTIQHPSPSLKTTNGGGYSQIIKRVLEHYDPSRNQVRTSHHTSQQQHPGGVLSTKGLVATK